MIVLKATILPHKTKHINYIFNHNWVINKICSSIQCDRWVWLKKYLIKREFEIQLITCCCSCTGPCDLRMQCIHVCAVCFGPKKWKAERQRPMPYPSLQLRWIVGLRFCGREHWPVRLGQRRKEPVQFPSFLHRITLVEGLWRKSQNLY